MRKLISLLAVGAALCVAGLASADTTPAHAKAPHWFAGTVTAVGSNSLTVGVLWAGPNDASLGGQTVTVAVTDHTRINENKRHRPIALAEVAVGDLVAIRAAGTSPTGLTAARIHVFCNCHWVGGTVAALGTSSFTVNVKRTGPYDTVLNNTTVTMQVNASTVYLRGRHGRRIGFSELQVGRPVAVVFAADGFFRAPGFDATKATFTAKRVRALAPHATPNAAADAAVTANVAA
jgi:hypothetical protein